MAVHWDSSGMQLTQSNLAQANAVTEGVRLDFGASLQRETGDASDVRLLRRIVLDPEAALNLLKLLNNLISRQKSKSQGGQA